MIINPLDHPNHLAEGRQGGRDQTLRARGQEGKMDLCDHRNGHQSLSWRDLFMERFQESTGDGFLDRGDREPFPFRHVPGGLRLRDAPRRKPAG